MGEHTKGPWLVDAAEAVSVRSGDGSRLCTINWLRGPHGVRGRIPDHEGEANARLIAAAPDLLEALQAIDKSWSTSFEHGPDGDYGEFGIGDDHKRFWRSARAAIAKATGIKP